MAINRDDLTQQHLDQRVVAVVQARLGSMRFPRKVLAEVMGRPLLAHLIGRLRRAESVNDIVMAIPDTPANDLLEQFCDKQRVACVRGSEDDVLDRFHVAARAAEADIVIRITGDCPMVDPLLVDRLVHELLAKKLDYVRTGSSFPNGFDVEVMRREALERAWREASTAFDREHVTPFVRGCADFEQATLELDESFGDCRVTLDEPADLVVIRSVFEHFGADDFSHGDVETLWKSQPELFAANRGLARDEGADMGTGQKLWRRAKRRIPGGTMLLSKQAQMHLPDRWPAYFSKAKGCRVWDLDGREYLDVGYMGIGTNILGYGHPKVDEAVRQVIDAGNMSTLNCPEEVELAERLCELHPWASMARFTRSGGEACAVAVRIARAASGKDEVAFCGYHGWHDWYLAANLADDAALDGHLLAGLQPRGVPRALASTAHPFLYNDTAVLRELLAGGDIGVIFMEVERSERPKPGFLEEVRQLATAHGAVLVFDECTSGFRQVLGGTHLVYGVEPDIAVFGKTLGNGYAINAVIGRESVMDAARDTFISSTFWTERIGPSAALASLAAMEEEDAPRRVHEIGIRIRKMWTAASAEAGLVLRIAGMPALSTFSMPALATADLKTFMTGRLLDDGMLGSPAFYASIAHDDAIIAKYSSVFEDALAEVAHSLDCGSSLIPAQTVRASTGFQRMN